MLRSVLLALVVFGLTTGPVSAFPGANGKIAFQSTRDGNYEVYAMNDDGAGQINLTNNPADDLGQAWSPDGGKLAFHSSRDGDTEVYVMNADGSGQTNVTKAPATPDFAPAWSPDAAKIAFVRGDPGEVWVMNADGSGQTQLTNTVATEEAPAWSPDGTRIAFHTDRDGNAEVYVMNADGSGQTNLTNDSDDDSWPAWSPDGSKLAFQTDRDGNAEVYVMKADGSGVANRSNNPTGGDFDPAWSPDATKVSFYTDRDGNNEIYAMNADGSGPTNLTKSAASDGRPDWQSAALPGLLPGSGPLSTDTTAPRLSRLSVTNRVFRTSGPKAARRKQAPRGTSFRYALSEAARTTFTIQRKLVGHRVGAGCRKPTARNSNRRRCTRYRTVGRLAQNGAAGLNVKHFSGKLSGRKLKPRRYRARVTAKDAAGNRSKTKTVRFRVVTTSA